MRKSNYINHLPNGTKLEKKGKADDLLAFCDEEVTEIPDWGTVPFGLMLVCVVENEGFDAARIIENKNDWQVVFDAMQSGDPRPVRFLLIKRPWVEQMADKPLEDSNE